MTLQLSREDVEAIGDYVCRKLSETCQCNMTHEAQAEMGHFWGMLRDEGGGNMSAGVESVRRVIHSDKIGRKWADTIVKVFLTVTVGAVGAGILAGVGAALKRYFVLGQP
jgi:hypothetical protein